jgi:hypothetical protein
MAGTRAEQQIKRETEAGGDEARPLQNAQRTRQVAKPQLIDEGEHQDRIDGDQPQRVEEPRQVARHAPRVKVRC